MRRVDGLQDRRFRDENLTNSSLSLPPGAITSLQISTLSVRFESRDVPYEPPAGLLEMSSFGQAKVPPLRIVVVLQPDGSIIQSIERVNSLEWTNMFLGDLVPLDEYGMPPIPYSYGPAIEGIWATVQSNTNLARPDEWTTVTTLPLRTNEAANHLVDPTKTNEFYRVKLP
jgi:hypothetical protein